jgi:hypothetical protein
MERQHGFELAGRILFCVSCAVLLGDVALEAYSSPRNLGQCLRELPGHLMAAVSIGGACALVPLTRARLNAGVRLGALVALVGSAVWIGITESVVVLYALVMSGFD